MKIKYKIRILQGEYKGRKCEVETSIDDLEECNISEMLIDDGLLDSYGNQTPHYEIIERSPIFSEKDMASFAEYIRNGLTNVEYSQKDHEAFLKDWVSNYREK